MSKRRWWLVALLSVVALLGAACGSDDDGGAVSDDEETTTTTAKPNFAAGTTMAALQGKGKIRVGTKFDQPGFGLKNPTSGEVEGFDVEIAKLVAQAIYGGSLDGIDANIEFVEAVSKNREPFIQDGTVDIVVATYTINDTRKQVVDFAGPYFVAEQDIMVKSDDTSIKSVTDLNGKKVCTVKGSTSEKNVRAQAPRADVVLFDTYSLCAEALGDGRVVAVTTDNTILQGLVKASSNAYKLVDAPFSEEPYGIGLKKGDDAFRDFLNDTLEKIFENGEWGKAFDRTLGKDGLGLKTPETPEVDRYTSAGAGGTTTTAGGTGTGSGSGGTTSTTRSGSSATTGSTTSTTARTTTTY
ncbi:MAG TPA: glutamate ABC transporter substrate-binding protein [Acidimicrobiales bacterium]|nr:glutamate ABC transporter substrate-binding protein [Acidimicrobiales bacterium]